MKTVVILGADRLGMAVADLLNPREMKLVGLGDTRRETGMSSPTRRPGS